MYTFFLLFPIFVSGMAFGVIILPVILYKIRYFLFMDADERVSEMLEKTKKIESKRIRKTEIFQKRLKAILSSVKDLSKEKKKMLSITSVEKCSTDEEIRDALRERKFYLYYEGDNKLTISW